MTITTSKSQVSLHHALMFKNKVEMEKSLSRAIKVFKYLFVLFSLVFWIGMVIDDWVLVEKYWKENWLMYLGAWFVYYVMYSFVFSCIYWSAASVFIWLNHKVFRLLKN